MSVCGMRSWLCLFCLNFQYAFPVFWSPELGDLRCNPLSKYIYLILHKICFVSQPSLSWNLLTVAVVSSVCVIYTISSASLMLFILWPPMLISYRCCTFLSIIESYMLKKVEALHIFDVYISCFF